MWKLNDGVASRCPSPIPYFPPPTFNCLAPFVPLDPLLVDLPPNLKFNLSEPEGKKADRETQEGLLGITATVVKQRIDGKIFGKQIPAHRRRRRISAALSPPSCHLMKV